MTARVTCLIPAYNEAARIACVLSVLTRHPLVGEVVVIDDGSTDGTAAIARGFGARVLTTPGNCGKTKALAHGLRATHSQFVLLIDADLAGLTAENVSALLRPVLDAQAAASISLRGNSPGLWRTIGIDYISGERVIARAMLTPHLDRLETLPRFGFEVFLNQLLIAERAKLKVVAWPDVASPSKSAKRGRLAGLRADAAMMTDIFRTISPLRALAQIRALRTLGGL
jgi:glycosyltransferase involved in cell wall biosynthesis